MMRVSSSSLLKIAVFIGASKRDLQAMPEAVKDEIGEAIQRAQWGGVPSNAEPLHGAEFRGVWEITANFATDTYRGAVFRRDLHFALLHEKIEARQQNDATGQRTFVTAIKGRANAARAKRNGGNRMSAVLQPKEKGTVEGDGQKIEFEVSSGNVFADLGLPDAPERQLKSEIAIHIGNIVAREGWTQAAAAARCGLTQPKMNDILRGRLRGYSVERLLMILNRLGRRVEVRIARRECPPEEAKTSVVMMK